MPYAQVQDLKLYYEEFGVGEPILFLHSHFSRGLLAFSSQILPFQGKYRCIFPDFRGHGRRWGSIWRPATRKRCAAW